MGLKERRIREKEQRKEQIIDAARTLVLKHGVFSVSVQQIAKLAELSVGTIYLYFGSKEEIFATLQEEILDMLHARCMEAIKGVDDPKDKIRGVAAAYNDFSRENKQYFDVVNYFISPSEIIFPQHLKAEIDQHGNRILAIIANAIAEGIERGDFEAVNAKRCAIVLWGTVHGLLQFKKLKDTILKGDDFNEIYSYSVECFISGLEKRQLSGRKVSVKIK
jgi:AcrR family transcriptional regulator